MKKYRIGLIGVGGIMNGAHIPEYLWDENCEITAIADISESALERTGNRLNLPPERRFKSHRELLRSGLVDAVDIATPNDAHVPIALEALDSGFPVSVEKPIGINFRESLELERKSQETGLPVFVCFSWRYRALPRYMKYLVDSGEIGKLYHIYFKNIKDSGLWEGRRLEWRFQKERAGSGVLCDLGSHLFDLVRFFGEEFESVFCDMGTIVRRRQKIDSDEWGDVTTDDWSNVICRLKSGINATVTLSRCATNEKDTIELYLIGEKGSLKFIYENGRQKLLKCVGEDRIDNTFREVSVPEDFKAGSQSSAYIRLLGGIKDSYTAVISDGIKSQAAVDAAIKSYETGRRVSIDELYRESL